MLSPTRPTSRALPVVAAAAVVALAVACGGGVVYCRRRTHTTTATSDKDDHTSSDSASKGTDGGTTHTPRWRSLWRGAQPCGRALARVLLLLLPPMRPHRGGRARADTPATTTTTTSHAHAHAHAAGGAECGGGIRPVAPLSRRGYTPAQLRRYDGVQDARLFVGLKGVVYEVGPQLYGPGQEYHVFAGKDVSRCLARHQLSDAEANRNWASCTADELAQLQAYVDLFEKKYPVVGWLVPDDDFDKV